MKSTDAFNSTAPDRGPVLAETDSHGAKPEHHANGKTSNEPWAARFHTLRRVSDKIIRRLKRVAGRPDQRPWIIRSRHGGGTSRYVDFAFGLDYLSPNSDLVGLFAEAMAPYGLSFLLINRHNLEQARRDFASGWLRPHVYLDLCSAVDSAFWELLQTASRAGIHTVANPEIQPTWTIKATSHLRLEAAGLPVPATVIISRDEPDRDLTAAERQGVGGRCVIKPSFGVAGRGAVVGVEPTKHALAEARAFNRKDDWLIQKMIVWPRLGPRQAYLRSYNVLGHRTMLWWAKEKGLDTYEMLTWEDARRYDLLPAVALTDRLAALTGMEFFSSEIAILGESGALAPERRFMLIDYVNDQCDMDPSPGPGKLPIPRDWVQWVCQRFAYETYRRKQGIARESRTPLWLPSHS